MSRAEVRSVDQMAIDRFGISGVLLMENAGRNAAEAIDELSPQGEICILCGKGNNGGDGYVIARHLELARREVRIVSTVDTRSLVGDAALNFSIAQRSGILITTASDAAELQAAIGRPTTIVDCLLGTGATGDPREPVASAIRYANQLNAFRIAIDLPSGLDCDTGEPAEPTFVADCTLTFVALKIGFSVPAAKPYVGESQVLSIGVPACLLREFR